LLANDFFGAFVAARTALATRPLSEQENGGDPHPGTGSAQLFFAALASSLWGEGAHYRTPDKKLSPLL
jgi:hypothetical protein